jgi:hypothetical protein
MSRDRVLLWVGIGLLVVAGCFWLHEWMGVRSLQRAMGTVTEVEERQDAQGNVDYFAHFRFRLQDESIVQAVSRRPSGSSYSERERVPVLYRADDPQDAVLAPVSRVYRAAIWFGVAGTVLFDIGAAMWIKRRQREMRGET